jgi:hypothetical protein
MAITKGNWQIEVIDQYDLIGEVRYWVVEVWQNLDCLSAGAAERLLGLDNFDYENGTLTNDTLESMIAQAVEFIKGEQK